MSNQQQIKNILCVRNDRFGEFLLTIPAFRALKKRFTPSRLTLVVNPYVEELAGQVDGVDEVMLWENRRHSFSEILAYALALKKKRFDLCVIFNPLKEFNIISLIAGIPVRIGYSHKFDFLLTHTIEDTKYLGQRHEVEYNLELASLSGAASDDKTLALNVDIDSVGGLANQLHALGPSRLIAIHPWTSDPVKQWPVDNFKELTRILASQKQFNIVIIGGKDEVPRATELCSNLNYPNILNLTGKTTLVQLAALLKRCAVLISGDSGPLHMACAVGTKVIALFRSDLPGKTAKRWGPWGEGHEVIVKKSLDNITVDEVLGRVKEVLEKR